MISGYVDAEANCLPRHANASDTWCISMSCMALCPVGLADQPRNSQYPALHLSHRALGRRQDRLQEGREVAVVIGAPKPSSDAVGVMLVTSAVLGCEAAAPEPWIDPSNSQKCA